MSRKKVQALTPPEWFSLEKYKPFEDGPFDAVWFQRWADALYSRWTIDRLLHRGEVALAQEVFSQIQIDPSANRDSSRVLEINNPESPAKPTTYNELYFLDPPPSNEYFDINELCLERTDQKSKLFLTIDLNRTDNEITEAISEELAKVHRRRGKRASTRDSLARQVVDWSEKRLLPILDLHYFWPSLGNHLDGSNQQPSLRDVLRLIHPDWIDTDTLGDYTRSKRTRSYLAQKTSALDLKNIQIIATLKNVPTR